jgi:autoinducer 2-degrading protein
MISLIIVVEVNPDQVDKFITYLTEEAADAIANEPGCRDFVISQSVTEHHVFTLAEFYDDEAALEEHRKTPHFLLFQERVSKYALIMNKREVVTGNVIFPSATKLRA